jgi:hypothetical protein
MTRPLLFAALAGLISVGCGDEGANDVTPVSHDQAVAILISQGYSEAAAECTIDGTDGQDVDLLDVFGRDQITQHEYDVMQAVGTFCVQQHGTTSTTSTPP